MNTMASDAHYVLIPPSTAITKRHTIIRCFVGLCVICVKAGVMKSWNNKNPINSTHGSQNATQSYGVLWVFVSFVWKRGMKTKKPHQSGHGSQNATQSYGTLWVFFWFVWKANLFRHPKSSISSGTQNRQFPRFGEGIRKRHECNVWCERRKSRASSSINTEANSFINRICVSGCCASL